MQFIHIDFIPQFATDVRHISSQYSIFSDAIPWVEGIAALFMHDPFAVDQDYDDEQWMLLLTQFDSSRNT
jgi:hypothetical protein